MSKLATALLTVIAGLLSVILYFYLEEYSRLRHVPGPFLARSNPFWIPFQRFRNRGVDALRALHAQSNVAVVGYRLVSVSDFSLARKVLNQCKDKPPMYTIARIQSLEREEFIDLAFTAQTYDLHKQITALEKAYYKPEFWKDRMQLYKEKADRFIQDLKMKSGDVIDISRYLNLFMWDVTANMNLGQSLGLTDDLLQGRPVVNEKILNAAAEAQWLFGLLAFAAWVQKLVPARAMIAFYPFKQLSDVSQSCLQGYSRAGSEDRRAKKGEIPCVAEVLSKDVTEHAIAQDRAHAILMSNITAGAEPVRSTLVALFRRLLSDPSRMKKLQAELRNDNDTYLKQCIMETLRMDPAASTGLARVVPSGGLDLGGHFIPAGTTVFFSPYLANRDAAQFPEPELFRPERWEFRAADADWLSPQDLNGFATCSFGYGSRQCPGMSLALNMTRYFVKSLAAARVAFVLEEGEAASELLLRDQCSFFSDIGPLLVRVEA